jgi:hypothetical protein
MGRVDTLVSKYDPTLHDRYVDCQLPIIGGFIGVKRDDFPVASGMSFSTGTSRFVYVTQNSSDPGSVDRDPIKGDSLAWKWQTIGKIEKAGVTWHPALFLGYWKNHYQVYAPTPSNDNLNVGDPRSGHDWTVSDFCYGLGTSVEIAQYGTTWMEFARSTISTAYGHAWPENTITDTTPFNRFSIGIEGNLHAIPRLNFPSSIETFVRIGWFNLRENSAFNEFESEIFGLGNMVAPDSKEYRYRTSARGVWGNSHRIIGTTLGLGATFLNKTISLDSYMAFFGKGAIVSSKGIEFGLNCGYCLK